MSAVDALFLDTNVLVYGHDRAEPAKGPTAANLVNRLFGKGWPIISTQVVAEFYWTVTHKLSPPLTHDEAKAAIQRYQLLSQLVPVTWPVCEKAMELLSTHALAYWDAQLLATAILNGAARLLTEDLQHRQVIEGVTILNPFAADFDEKEIGLP